MGQKVNPNGFRLGVNRTWSSRWFSKSNYAKFLHQDLEIKSYVEKKLKNASIAKINIERAAKKIRISIYSSRPGIIIGKKGADIEDLKNKLTKLSNLEVEMPVAYMPTAAPDDYRCFVVPWPETETTNVTGFVTEPGNQAIVHHVITYVVPPNKVAAALAIEEADEDDSFPEETVEQINFIHSV